MCQSNQTETCWACSSAYAIGEKCCERRRKSEERDAELNRIAGNASFADMYSAIESWRDSE